MFKPETGIKLHVPLKAGEEKPCVAIAGDGNCPFFSALFPRDILLAALLVSLLPFMACSTAETQKKAFYHYQMGLSYLGENNFTGALVELSEAEKLTPDDPDLLNKLALAYFYKQRYELAEQRYLKALKLKPGSSEIRNNLGVNYLQMNRWDNAIQQFKLVVDDIFFKDQEGANINLGLAYFGKGDYQASLTILRGIIVANPRNLLGRLHLGRTYMAMDRPELAIAEYRKALDINKDFAMAHYQLALVYLKQRNIPMAMTSFREVEKLAPESEIGLLSREYLNTLE